LDHSRPVSAAVERAPGLEFSHFWLQLVDLIRGHVWEVRDDEGRLKCQTIDHIARHELESFGDLVGHRIRSCEAQALEIDIGRHNPAVRSTREDRHGDGATPCPHVEHVEGSVDGGSRVHRPLCAESGDTVEREGYEPFCFRAWDQGRTVDGKSPAIEIAVPENVCEGLAVASTLHERLKDVELGPRYHRVGVREHLFTPEPGGSLEEHEGSKPRSVYS